MKGSGEFSGRGEVEGGTSRVFVVRRVPFGQEITGDEEWEREVTDISERGEQVGVRILSAGQRGSMEERIGVGLTMDSRISLVCTPTVGMKLSVSAPIRPRLSSAGKCFTVRSRRNGDALSTESVRPYKSGHAL